jgi:HTH DNA binding domain
VIEVSRTYLGYMKNSELLESLKILQLLRSDAKGFAGVCKLKLRNPEKDDLKKLVGTFGIIRIESLSKEKDGSHVAYLEGRPMRQWQIINAPGRGYQNPPFELTSATWRKTFLGTESQIKRSLKKAERAGLKFRIVWAGEAQFRPGSLVSLLTEHQRKTLHTAHQIGYYDFPRRAGSDKLAKTLALSKSTVSEHLRRAEKTILDQIFSE